MSLKIQGISSLETPCFPKNYYSPIEFMKRFSGRVWVTATSVPFGMFCGGIGWVLGKIAKGIIVDNAHLYTEYFANSVAERSVGWLIPNTSVVWFSARCLKPFVSGCSLETVVKVADVAEASIPWVFYGIVAVGCAIKQEYDEFYSGFPSPSLKASSPYFSKDP